MRVFHHSLTQRSVTQRKRFKQQKSVAYFFTQLQTPKRRLQTLAALRKQMETTSIFLRNAGRPEANSTNQSCN